MTSEHKNLSPADKNVKIITMPSKNMFAAVIHCIQNFKISILILRLKVFISSSSI